MKILDDITGIGDKQEQVKSLAGVRINPNPFDISTTLTYSLKDTREVHISVFDQQGKLIKILLDDTQTPGEYSIDVQGSGLESGVYLCLLRAGNEHVTYKMIKR